MKRYRNLAQKPRIVVDTNVWISGIVFGGKPEQVLRLAVSEQTELVISEALLAELRQKIAQKFPDYVAKLNKLEMSIREDFEIVRPAVLMSPMSRDPEDDKFIEAALAGGADYIVSGDRDLLELGRYQGIDIVKPAEFLETIQSS